MIYKKYLKRILDVALSGVSLVILSPLMALIAIAVRFEDGESALFFQERIGLEEQPFYIIKFRSMAVNAGNLPSAEASALEVTRIGRILRRTNLDELPQLLNIFKGDMSVVGPRPALPTQNFLTSLRLTNGALACRPGLTGLAQVSSYDGMSEEEKAMYDARYASNITFLKDLWIIFRTFSYLAHRPPTY